jgi:hypothetical protein
MNKALRDFRLRRHGRLIAGAGMVMPLLVKHEELMEILLAVMGQSCINCGNVGQVCDKFPEGCWRPEGTIMVWEDEET